jgi:ribonuclease G
MQGDATEQMKADYIPRGVEEIRVITELDAEISRQLRQAGERTLALPSGGNIMIDRCEAMTVIDVNTASSPGLQNKEQTVTQTNLEACVLIAQQVRLRNLSGIILIDFIDMESETDRSLVLNKLEDCFREDRIKTVIHGWTRLGLMEMTRKRTRRERAE